LARAAGVYTGYTIAVRDNIDDGVGTIGGDDGPGAFPPEDGRPASDRILSVISVRDSSGVTAIALPVHRRTASASRLRAVSRYITIDLSRDSLGGAHPSTSTH
jgi:hypothetical protein